MWLRFEYDEAGRLVKVMNDAGNALETYTYGASRNRLVNETAAGRTYYAWGGQAVFAEYFEPSNTPTWTKSYVYAGPRLLSTFTKNGSSEVKEFHHPDRLGTKLVTNPSANTSYQQSTLPFGTALPAESTGFSNQVFTSYDRSNLTGVDYAINRAYSTGQARFTQVDPIGMGSGTSDPQSNNLYAYVQNNPVDYVDPSGLNEEGPEPTGGYYSDGCLSVYIDGFFVGYYGRCFFGGGVRGFGSSGGSRQPDPLPTQNCAGTLSLAGENTDEGALARLIFQEATPLSRFINAFPPTSSGAANALQNYQTELNMIAAIVHNRANLLSTRSDLMTGFGNRNASLADVVYSRGASGTQFAGFTPSGISRGIRNRINNALSGPADSADCNKLKDAIDTARNYRPSAHPGLANVYGMRTANSVSPGGNFILLDGLAGSGNDFYGLRQSYLNPQRR